MRTSAQHKSDFCPKEFITQGFTCNDLTQLEPGHGRENSAPFHTVKANPPQWEQVDMSSG